MYKGRRMDGSNQKRSCWLIREYPENNSECWCKGTPFLNFLFSISRIPGPDSINADPWIPMDPVYGSALFETISHGNLYTRARVTPEPLSTRTRAIPKSITHGSAGPDSTNADPWIYADPEHGSGSSPGYLRVIFGFLSRETIEFPGHGFPGMDII